MAAAAGRNRTADGGGTSARRPSHARSQTKIFWLSLLLLKFPTTAVQTIAAFESVQKRSAARREAKARSRIIWLFTQYLLSLLAGQPPPPTPAQTERPRLILLPANALGATCLDGSPPGYYFRPGTGAGKRMWHIYLPGGAWCGSAADCVARSKTWLGSSTFYPDDPNSEVIRPPFNGMLSSNSTHNPPFYSWNLVRPIYCDGGGFAGTTGRLDVGNGTGLHLSGWKIMRAIMADLKANRGIKSAAQILLSGSSAGGQAVISLCDRIAAAFPWAPTKCIADSGFFIDSKDRWGGFTWRGVAKGVVDMHRPKWSSSCMDGLPKYDQWKCFFPQYTLSSVTTPIFISQTLFDYHAFQIGGILPWNTTYTYQCLREVIRTSKNVTSVIQRKEWSKIAWKTQHCTPLERAALFTAASILLEALGSIIGSKDTVAAFVPAGIVHGMVMLPAWKNPWVQGVSLERAVVEWFANVPSERFIHS
ncbi:hypothetical protein CLOM_g8355 [Closterium sp. NIES-68]|nr:hypothetical protein CLOM_g8355 [Closterium sp. NIES-68]GJP77414.1 hypothetical protein CLOP_g7811 [Closterium sp. NIES-67]